MAKKKPNFMATVQTVGAGAAGAFAMDMITGKIEEEIAKKNPENIGYAPGIASIGATLGAVYTEKGTLLNDALTGAAIVSATELLQVVMAKKPTTTPPPEGGGTTGAGGTGETGATGLNGQREMAAFQNRLPGIRMNGGLNYMY